MYHHLFFVVDTLLKLHRKTNKTQLVEWSEVVYAVFQEIYLILACLCFWRGIENKILLIQINIHFVIRCRQFSVRVGVFISWQISVLITIKPQWPHISTVSQERNLLNKFHLAPFIISLLVCSVPICVNVD